MSRVTQDTATAVCASRTGLSPSMELLSRSFRSHSLSDTAVLQPPRCIATTWVWALPRSLATTRGIIIYFLFLQVLRCFSSLRLPTAQAVYRVFSPVGCPIRRSADQRLMRLPAAFRSLPRPSSLTGAKAFTVRPYALPRASWSRRILTNGWYTFCCTLMSRFSFACSVCQRSLPLARTVENNGFEPLTPCLQSRCSSQLS